ncbi:carbohydrate ABC transporter permease [Paenibacillus ehimensis]|uniref:carbohydrate ABC transporter permease n=1 Tax=Paenibacillus ehimensis TaxID=79264 RepID=UPI0004725197|nr:sugar ABC transporter permease [Paenibacillus ehimensis]MEC0207806.1 sugar ABC transporter permease [Paenibacillus ehimensis]
MNVFRNRRLASLYALPALVFVSVFVLAPLALNLYYSLFSFNAFSPNKTYIGFDNFKRLFADPVFYTAIRNNTLYAVISFVFQVGAALVIAAILEHKLFQKMQPFFRTVFFIPSVISFVVIGLLWQFIYNPDTGIINLGLKALGLHSLAQPWLGDSNLAIYAAIWVSQWQYIGYNVMLFLIAMHNIPKDFYEAADLDGAGPVRSFFAVTLPSVKEMILVASMITVLGAYKLFDEIYILTSGGPGRSTEVLGTMLYRAAFRNDEMGYAASIATVVFVITMLLSLCQIKLSGTAKDD